jgi:hypothetical protein
MHDADQISRSRSPAVAASSYRWIGASMAAGMLAFLALRLGAPPWWLWALLCMPALLILLMVGFYVSLALLIAVLEFPFWCWRKLVDRIQAPLWSYIRYLESELAARPCSTGSVPAAESQLPTHRDGDGSQVACNI